MRCCHTYTPKNQPTGLELFDRKYSSKYVTDHFYAIKSSTSYNYYNEGVIAFKALMRRIIHYWISIRRFRHSVDVELFNVINDFWT
jgi:hypothetical protein